MTNQPYNATTRAGAGQRLRAPRRLLRAPRPARGLSLTEVLISMGVLAVGLLGVASVFPVGGHYMQRGDRSDRADAIAQAALNDAITRGLLDPERWVAYEESAGAKGAKAWTTLPTLGLPDTFTRPFAADFRERLRNLNSDPAMTASSQRLDRLNNVVGSVFFIDPLAVAANTDTTTPYGADGILSAFPASVASAATGGVLVETPFTGITPIGPFQKTSNPNDLDHPWAPWENLIGWPIQRLTVRSNAPLFGLAAEPMGLAEADRIVSSDDDLALELPDDEDRPSQARFQRSGGSPLLRQARQEYSWALTVAPTSHEARLALANGGDAAYDVSAVVYHRRSVGRVGVVNPSSILTRDLALRSNERLVRASVVASTPSGGEVRLFLGDPRPSAMSSSATDEALYDSSWNDPLNNPEPPFNGEPAWEQLRTGQWMLLFGPHPTSTSQRPLMFAQWYRVLAVDRSEEETPTTLSRAHVTVSLRGPDWPWRPGTPNPTDPMDANPDELSEILHAVIVPDVVSVYTRTLNLRSGAVWER